MERGVARSGDVYRETGTKPFLSVRSVHKVSLLTRLINMHDEMNLGLLDMQHLFARMPATARSKINIRDLYDLLRISLPLAGKPVILMPKIYR